MEESVATFQQFDFTSHETAICLIPPQNLWPRVDPLRSLYDKAYGKWPPHINLIYPFVRPELLSQAADILSQLDLTSYGESRVQLEAADVFIHKHYNTIFLRPNAESGSPQLLQLRNEIWRALNKAEKVNKGKQGRFQPHLTVAQSEDAASASHKFLVEKVRLAAPLDWKLGEIALLIRDAVHPGGDGTRHMRIWGTLNISSGSFVQQAGNPYESADHPPRPVDVSSAARTFPQATYRFSESDNLWQAFSPASPPDVPTAFSRLVVASYNVLAEFEWPPQSVRYSALVENLLSTRAVADILVLQEVTDHFLPFLLANRDICNRYPFATHGPPGQAGVGPLPSLLNVVVLSKYPLQWEYLPFQRKHKGCTVVTFPTIGTHDSQGCFLPLVLAGCHLSQGLVDGAVVAKKNEIQRIVDHLSSDFAKNPWILAGDFNLATSSYTIDAARRKQDLSSQTVQYLRNIDLLLLHSGFQDAWLATRLESGESSGVSSDQQSIENTFEGEQGATFDPLSNTLAAELVGSGMNNRPQRYDRILVKGNECFRPQGFNIFGRTPIQDPQPGCPMYASDHWGIRCLLVCSSPQASRARSSTTPVLVKPQKASITLQAVGDLKSCLEERDSLPTESDRIKREAALKALERALVSAPSVAAGNDERSGLALKLVPVGSFGLGVWTSSSDIDCLGIGSISSKTFFTLALQRLRKAASDGISVLRRVKANSGYMLELEVHGIKVDLQYCTATSIAEGWPEIMNRPSHDPVFALPIQTLAKLKPVRDLVYLRRSIPDMTQYRLAHALIKAWAKTRGIYSAKFGFLGGIHISVLLVPVCKMLAASGEAVSASDVVVTFFNHYATFDWKNQMVFDPFFHKDLKYHRTFREALCLLGWHAPSLNTASSASVPTVRTIATEFNRAISLLSGDGMTWDGFLNETPKDQRQTMDDSGAMEFLKAYRRYIKIDVHYWGASTEKGSRYVGWLESRCIMLLVDIDRKLNSMVARIWPARFTDRASAEANGEGSEYQGSYLVGLELDIDQTAGSPQEQVKRAHEALRSVLQDFEARIRGDEKYFDATSCWMTAAVARGSELPDMTLDESRWGELVADTGDDSTDDDLEFEEEEDERGGGDGCSQGRGSSSKKGGSTHASRASMVAKPAGLGKFRTAADVLNRLRWDVNLNTSDYIVGYEDRFKGAQERAVEQWKSEQTDEEFIPQHRILYFKRKSDGSILWERRSRIDDLFGSGIKFDKDSGLDTP